jgi:SHS2 domain-containing protein
VVGRFGVDMSFQYRGDIAHADIAFDAWGKTLEELFKGAAAATMQVMVEDLTTVRPLERVDISLEQEDVEMLLFDFLNEFIFYKDARRLLLLPAKLSIAEGKDGAGYSLQATLQGEEIEAGRHSLNTDVKAVTMLRFSVARVAEGWRATVVLDV